MISLIRNKFDFTVNQMRPLSPVIRIKDNQRRPLTVFDHTFDVRKGVFSCSVPYKRKYHYRDKLELRLRQTADGRNDQSLPSLAYICCSLFSILSNIR